MYYYGARYYDPRLSIFISVDPLAEQTFEPYSYTGNNPIMFTDPTGMSKDDVYRREGDNFIFVRKNNQNEGTKDHVGVFTQDENGEYIQETDNNGNLIYEAKDIAEGILSKYQSFVNSPRYFDVNGVNADGSSQPTENDILNFAVQLQSMVKKEISGYALTDKAINGEVKGMMIEPYKVKNSRFLADYENDYSTSYSVTFTARKAIGKPFGSLLGNNRYPSYHFHTHPEATPPSTLDMEAAAKNPLLDRFIINNRFQKLQYGEKGFFKNRR